MVLGVSRTSRYRKPTVQTSRDEADIIELRAIHDLHPSYGYRRLAIALDWGWDKTRRLMKQAGIQGSKTRRKAWRSTAKAEEPAPVNQLAKLEVPTQSGAWVQDFTYMWFCGRWYYVAVILELEHRRVVGWALGGRHTSGLILQALKRALAKYPAPTILHSDRGSEYLSTAHFLACEHYGITISCSAAASPWQNGYMESWFGKFKTDLGPPSKFQDLGELYEAIAGQIYYYNHERIHTSLGMSPAAHAERSEDEKLQPSGRKRTLRDKVLQIFLS